MEDEKLGLQLQDLRIKKNMTQEMVAEYMDVSRQTISKWEANKSKPSTKNLIRLAEFFEVPLSRLTGTVDHEKEIKTKLEIKMETYKIKSYSAGDALKKLW